MWGSPQSKMFMGFLRGGVAAKSRDEFGTVP
eukprot:CAMPEP_0204568398 /NCGR_PEP_ID=MMETSP0661-20131031/37163_1 /ASSEMBLY_ACC=CAM_ASM_000606 /TAXON_ID=109239 /ORGANISM="Alexandrium margalefi, Strain AMGDE01CS-322" /LENGTH=30 /DNA_ID= /DNA_START= /DNA_END= /DNA_ORIENTATION=